MRRGWWCVSDPPLFDLPDAALPDPETPAPVRFIAVWDAMLLVHARRTQILPEAYRPLVFNTKTPHSVNTFLLDGQVAGTWRFEDGEIKLSPMRTLALTSGASSTRRRTASPPSMRMRDCRQSVTERTVGEPRGPQAPPERVLEHGIAGCGRLAPVRRCLTVAWRESDDIAAAWMPEGTMKAMEHADVQAWLDRYVDAWRANEPEPIKALITEDAVYRYRPYADPEQTATGNAAIAESWLEEPDAPGSWEARYEPYAVDGDRAVAVGFSRYRATENEPERTYHNAYLLRFAPDGRCSEFSEFYMLEGK